MAKLIRQLGNIERNLHKKDIVELAESNAQSIIDSGKYDLLKVYVELKRYETYLKAMIQFLKSPALDQATEKQKKSFNYNDARVNVSPHTKWDFSEDNEWTELDRQIEQLKKEKKDREKYLKDSNESGTSINKETGEIIENFELPKEVEYRLSISL